MKPLEGECVSFQPRLRAGYTLGEFIYILAKSAALGGADEILERGLFYIPQRRVDDRAGKELAGAPYEEIVEAGGAGLFHPSRLKETKEFVAVITPLETGGIVKGLQLFQVPGG
jgi:hypothetical protein